MVGNGAKEMANSDGKWGRGWRLIKWVTEEGSIVMGNGNGGHDISD